LGSKLGEDEIKLRNMLGITEMKISSQFKPSPTLPLPCTLSLSVSVFAIFHHSTTDPLPLPQPWRFEDLPDSLVRRPNMIIDTEVAPPERQEPRETALLPPWQQQLGVEEPAEVPSGEGGEDGEEREEEPSSSTPRQRSPTSGDMEDKLHKIRGLYSAGDEDQRRELLACLDDSASSITRRWTNGRPRLHHQPYSC
jgi:hypothetical protein